VNLLSRRKNKIYLTVIISILICICLSFVSARMFVDSVNSRILFPNRFTGWLITPSEWLAKWLENPTCEVPCWENIVPGETSREQTKALLSGNPEIASVEEGDVIPYGSMLFVKIYNDTYMGNVSIKFDNQNIAQEIDLTTFGGKLYLGDMILAYGSPKQVLVRDTPDNESVSVNMLYPESGMVLHLFIHNLGGGIPYVNINEYSEIWNIYLDAPGLKYYFEISEITDGTIDPRLLSEWKGYTIYP